MYVYEKRGASSCQVDSWQSLSQQKQLQIIEMPIDMADKKNWTHTITPLQDATDQNSDPEQNHEELRVKITYCKHVGIAGTWFLLLPLLIAGLMFFGFYLYSYYFQNVEREFVWIFLVLAILYISQTCRSMCTWKKSAARLSVKYTAGLYPDATVRKKRRRHAFIEFCRLSKKIYRLFKINGKYYLYKLYFLEYIESINQINNMFSIYVCALKTLPLLVFCLIFAADGLLRGWFLRQVHSPLRRLQQVVGDMIVDIICIAYPIGYIYFVYDIPISMTEMMAIVLWPSVCMISKMRSIFREIMRINMARSLRKESESMALDYSVVNDEVAKSAKLQESSFPRIVRRGLALYNIVCGLFYLFYAAIQLRALLLPPDCTVLHPNDDPNEVKTLYNGCMVKTPYCGSQFAQTCNCAALHVKTHNFTMLPGIFCRDGCTEESAYYGRPAGIATRKYWHQTV